MQTEVNRILRRNATRSLKRAESLLFLAGKQLEAAGRTAPDRYHSDRLRSLAIGVRQLVLPMYRIAISLRKGCEL